MALSQTPTVVKVVDADRAKDDPRVELLPVLFGEGIALRGEEVAPRRRDVALTFHALLAVLAVVLAASTEGARIRNNDAKFQRTRILVWCTLGWAR